MICGSSLKGAQKHQGAQISLQTHFQVFASAIPPPGSWAPPPTPWNSDFFKCILLYMHFYHHSFLPHYHLHHREHKNSHEIPQEMQKISVKLHSDTDSSSQVSQSVGRKEFWLHWGRREELKWATTTPKNAPKQPECWSSCWIHAGAPSRTSPGCIDPPNTSGSVVFC